ncbi:MAG TPA: 5'-nucleotidase C-terminal domain-containing protein [Polyangiaceae bacterium]|nr:5'-nucleotidase C-terminal domain-containing protein [Polyangiaceae bacterium]
MSRLALLALFVAGCGTASPPELHGEVELVLFHTSDLHSALFPFRERIAWSDARRGLGAEGSLERIGGLARLAGRARDERRLASRSLLLDSGDAFQGSLAFDTWAGEPELLALAALGVQAQALGNHELDRGSENLRERYRELATFPLLGANYLDDSGAGVAELVSPFVVLDARGLRIGVIGVANVHSVPALRERPNELGVLARDAAGAVQGAVDALRPVVDVVVVLTHLGLDGDRALVRETSGIDVVLGGHQHIVLDEPLEAMDCGGSGEGTIRDAWGRERRCTARRVLVVHSGAYAKYLGKLALTLDDRPAHLGATYDALDRHEVTSARFELLPVHAGLPEDAGVAELLEPYRPRALERLALTDVLGYAPATLRRVGVTGADSPLGNFAASAARWLAGSDLAIVGASSLRRDLAAGALDADTLERSFPFDDPVLRIRVTGSALGSVFERAAATAAARDCRMPVHVAGALVRLRCPCVSPPCAELFVKTSEICCESDAECTAVHGACASSSGAAGRCLLPVSPSETLSLATTAYLADGNGGLLARVAAGDRELVAGGLREVVTEALRESPACDESTDCDGGCPATLLERSRDALCGDGASCSLLPGACERARALCKTLPCLDERAGALRDGRIRIESR